MKAEAEKRARSLQSPPETEQPEPTIEDGRREGAATVPQSTSGGLADNLEAASASANTVDTVDTVDDILTADRETTVATVAAVRPPQASTTPGQPWLNRLLEGSSTVLRGLGLDDRLGRILLSVVLAVLLWFYVTGLENPSQITSFRGLPLEVRGIGQNLKVVNTEPLPTVDASFQAPQNILSTLKATDIHPYIDLSALGAGVHRVPVKVEFSGGIGNSISNLAVTPSDVQVQLEVQATRSFPVEVSVIGTPAFGYAAEPPQVEPSQVSVTGSESAISRIASVVVTVDIEEKAGTQRGFKTPIALDSAGQEIPGLTFTPSSVQVTVPIKLVLSNRVVPVRVPIIGNPAPGYSVNDIKIDPTNVMICCAPNNNILEAVDSVTTAPIAITGTTSTVITTTPLILPPGVQLYPGQSSVVTVTVGISTFDTTWQVSVAPIIEGLQSGYGVVLSPTSIDLTLAGTFAQFQALKPDDVRASIDVTNLAAGTYEITPDIIIPDGIRPVTVNPPTITVSIIAPTPVPPTPTNTPTPTPVPPTPTGTPTPNPEVPATVVPSPTRPAPISSPTPTTTATPTVPGPTPFATQLATTPTATPSPETP